MSGAISNVLYSFWNQVVFVASNIRVFDIIDILVIAYLIYKGIGFLRETRAGQLVKGIVILLLAYALSKWFDLTVLKWLLSLIVDSAIIALAVIFQPELRRMLEKVGQTSLSHTQVFDIESETMNACIDSVAKAARSMQETKTGALIVFERKTQLGEIINTGTVIDAMASTSMLCNIFFHNSPLHDGALIIREGRLYAAGCLLPLSQNLDIPASLGTRHRAAVGMTENSDAVVLVVSEETGNISIVCNGRIKTGYNGASAADELKRLLLNSDSAENENKLFSTIKSLNPFVKRRNKTEGGSDNED